MVKRVLLTFAMSLIAISNAHAGIIFCGDPAIAVLTDGTKPVECLYDTGNGLQDTSAWVNSNSALGLSVTTADKTDGPSTIAGYEITVNDTGVQAGYTHNFDVDGPDGKMLDYLVISWKQQGDIWAAIFKNVTLDVAGALISLNKNGGGDISHASVHIGEEKQDVPEPGTLALLGLGLLGLAIGRRRAS